MLPCRYLQTDFRVYIKRQKTQNSQHDIEGKEQNWKIDTTRPQDLL